MHPVTQSRRETRQIAKAARLPNQPGGGLFDLGCMAYAALWRGPMMPDMPEPAPILPSDGETIAELRELYRAAEARAARLRLLSVSGRELAEATVATLEEVAARCAQRSAFFAGCRRGIVTYTEIAPELTLENTAPVPIRAPGDEGRTIATLWIEGLRSLDDLPIAEDRDAFEMHLDLMGLTIDRIGKERERSQLLSRLQERERTLGKLLDQIFTAQEEERRRVSHELHDGVAQTATALVRILETPEASGMAQDAIGGQETIKPAQVARSLVTELRRVIGGLRPTLLDDLGLVPALQALAEGLAEDGYEVTHRLEGSDTRLPALMETAVFRVAQETVANIRKHAGGPCHVLIEAHFDQDPMILRIEDSGVGPSEQTRLAGPMSGNNVGIEVMKERMAALGGSLEWHARESGGVAVEARLPAQF